MEKSRARARDHVSALNWMTSIGSQNTWSKFEVTKKDLLSRINSKIVDTVCQPMNWCCFFFYSFSLYKRISSFVCLALDFIRMPNQPWLLFKTKQKIQSLLVESMDQSVALILKPLTICQLTKRFIFIARAYCQTHTHQINSRFILMLYKILKLFD